MITVPDRNTLEAVGINDPRYNASVRTLNKNGKETGVEMDPTGKVRSNITEPRSTKKKARNTDREANGSATTGAVGRTACIKESPVRPFTENENRRHS